MADRIDEAIAAVESDPVQVEIQQQLRVARFFALLAWLRPYREQFLAKRRAQRALYRVLGGPSGWGRRAR